MSKSELTKDEIIAQQSEIIAAQAQLIQELKEELRLQKEKVDHLIRVIHSSKSEKFDANQLELLLDADTAKKQEAADGEEEPQAANTQSKKRGTSKRKPRLPENIPTVECVLLPEEVKANPDAYRQVGEKRSEKLDVTPTRYTRRVIIRPTFVEKHEPIPRWLTAPAPPSLLEGSILTPSLLAHVLTAKYCDHLPLDRQTKIMERRHGIYIPTNTLCHWVNFAAETLNPLYQLIAEKLRTSSQINIDESPVSYLPQKEQGSKQGYFWVYRSQEAGVLYDWQLGRGHECLDAVLKKGDEHFQGLIQCDGYQAYQTWADKHSAVSLAGCWVHARRKFVEALPYQKEAASILHFIREIYRAEHQYQEWIAQSHHPPEAIKYYRRRHLKPLLRALRKELRTLYLSGQYLPKSKMGKALTYALNQWPKLGSSIKHSITLDNNLAENAVRPLKLGAKNWLFIGNEDTGWRSAVIYTLIENIRSAGKDPYAYLQWVFERIPHMSNQQSLEPLLPQSWLASQIADTAEKQTCTAA